MFCNETNNKPFPRIVYENSQLFANIRTILDIGAGRGRFAQYFLKGEYKSGNKPVIRHNLYHVKSPIQFIKIEKYVAIEPCQKSCKHLQRISDHRLVTICTTWEEAKNLVRNDNFDMVIFWDVLMFMKGNPCKIVNEIIAHAKQFFLFSLHPVKTGYLPRYMYKPVIKCLDNHPSLIPIAKKYYNRIYKIILD